MTSKVFFLVECFCFLKVIITLKTHEWKKSLDHFIFSMTAKILYAFAIEVLISVFPIRAMTDLRIGKSAILFRQNCNIVSSLGSIDKTAMGSGNNVCRLKFLFFSLTLLLRWNSFSTKIKNVLKEAKPLWNAESVNVTFPWKRLHGRNILIFV